MPRRRSARGTLMAVGLAAVVIGGACNGDDETADDSPPSPLVVTEVTEPRRDADGTLRIGLLAPQSGDGAAIGQSVSEAANLAVTRINDAGGVGGQPVALMVENEGDSVPAAADAIAELDDAGVDAVVGPTSSLVALATLGDLLTAGILTCSPTATALALDDYPNSELFFRTVPSDSLQALAIAELAEQTGSRSVGIAHLDDAYGRPLAEATANALTAAGLDVAVEVPFDATAEELAPYVNQLQDAAADVVVIIGDPDQGVRLLSAIGDAVRRSDWLPDVVVNGAMRRPASPQLVQDLPEELRTRIRGVSPLARPLQPEEPDGLFATNAYDCVNLIALAAAQAGTDQPEAMDSELVEVSRSGQGCAAFAECVELLTDNRNIDYEGPGGEVEIGARGNAQRGRFDIFEFDEAGIDQSIGLLSITAVS